MTAAARGMRNGFGRGVALVVACVLIVALAAVQLLRPENELTGASGVRPSAFVAELPGRGGELCTRGVEVPAGTGAVQLVAGTYGPPGPRLTAVLRDAADGTVLARGAVDRGWTQGVLAIPLQVDRERAVATFCLRSSGGARVAVAGEPHPVPTTRGLKPAKGRISVLARAAQPRSLVDRLPVLAERIGRGNAAWVGPWTVWAIGLLVLAGVGLGGWAVARTPAAASSDQRRIPAPARLLAAAALATGLAWSLLTPPFHVPDEISHVAYVEYLTDVGRLPIERADIPPLSEGQRQLLDALRFSQVIGRRLEHVSTTAASEAYLREVERRDFPPGGGNATTASANPPLYYLLQAPIFLATSGGSPLTQLMAMRVLSVLLLGGSVLFAFLFVRELLPGSPWTWTAGGLACAFQPMLGFVSGGVNPDSLLFLAGTALLFGVARTLGRGLTMRRACLIAVALAVGLLTKPLFLAMVPVAVAGLALAAMRQRRGWLRPTAVAAAIAVVPVTLVAVIGAAAFDHPYFATATAVAGAQAETTASGSSFARQASFMLQLYLPRLPFLTDQIPGVPIRDVWINGLLGTFGWLDYDFGPAARDRGTAIFLVLLGLAGVALVRFRRAVRDRWPLMLCCLIGLAAVATVVGVVDYQAYLANSPRFEQARYLLPLLALYAGLFGLAARALGPMWGRLMLPLLWAAVSLHTLAALILTANRYYI